MDSPSASAFKTMYRAQELAQLARRYCALVEASDNGNDAWLRDIAALLPRLQAALETDRASRSYRPPDRGQDLDARFDLYSRLRQLLADRDPYWLEFDHWQDGAEAMTGSLADDLTDIYFELRQGLQLLDRDPDRALDAWYSGYEGHWARHLIDAERHLAALASADRLKLAALA